MKHFQYVGGPVRTGATFRDGSQMLLYKGNTYLLDENNEYVKTLLLKRNAANGMPAPWLVEVSAPSAMPPSAPPDTDETTETSTKKQGKN